MYSTGEMGLEREGIIEIVTQDGSKIKLNEDDIKEFKECMEGFKGITKGIAICAGFIAGAVTQVQAPNPIAFWGSKALIALCGMGIGAATCQIASAFSCGGILADVVKSKMKNQSSELSGTDLVQEKDELSNKELLDYTPNISSLDLSGFTNVSSDTSDVDRIVNKQESSKEEGNRILAPKKSVTYDDLWKKHVESSDERGKPKAYTSEGTDFDKILGNEPGLEKKKIRMNKYGDILE